ncbi:MAG: ROK family protein [Solobacterium sp.]|nr:ROK family protein [Solobacterium sp.]
MKTIGIDIGGTQLRAAVLDENYNIIDIFKTPNDRSLTCRENCDKLIDFICSQNEEFSGIGIGAPGPMNMKTGTILNPPNLIGWDNFPITEYFREKTGLPAVLNNDANVAGLAEALLGSGKGYESVCFMGISTGLGGAYVYQGKLVNGANGNAAEWWNMIVNEDPYGHKNANPGSLNEQAAGSGLHAIASRIYGQETHTKELFDRYYSGDATAVEIIDRAVDVLAKGIANITCVIDPDIFIIGGSVAIFHPFYIEAAAKKAKQYMNFPETLHIEPAKFGDDAGLIGAALLIETAKK